MQIPQWDAKQQNNRQVTGLEEIQAHEREEREREETEVIGH